MLFGMVQIAASAKIIASGSCGSNLTWTLDDKGVLNINGSGAMWDYLYENEAPWKNYLDPPLLPDSNPYCIRTVNIENGVTSIGEGAFWFGTNITEVTLPNSIRSIGMVAFDTCVKLGSITIPDSVTSIGYYAFENCSGLTEITIGKGLTDFNGGVFKSCTNLDVINISKDNPNYSSEGGMIFNKDKSELVVCPGAKKEYTIPVSVTSIAEDVFGWWTWYSQLTDIYYGGDEDDWNKISNASGNEGLKNVTIHYTSPYSARVISGNIVLQAQLEDAVSDECFHAAIYSADNTLLDYIIVPQFGEFNTVNVVFKDIPESKYAKVFLWNSLSSLEPIAGAKKVSIIREE
jgi:hypothetical protein